MMEMAMAHIFLMISYILHCIYTIDHPHCNSFGIEFLGVDCGIDGTKSTASSRVISPNHGMALVINQGYLDTPRRVLEIHCSQFGNNGVKFCHANHQPAHSS